MRWRVRRRSGLGTSGKSNGHPLRECLGSPILVSMNNPIHSACDFAPKTSGNHNVKPGHTYDWLMWAIDGWYQHGIVRGEDAERMLARSTSPAHMSFVNERRG